MPESTSPVAYLGCLPNAHAQRPEGEQRERGQERGDLGGAHLSRVALPVEEDVPLDPVDIRLLGAPAVVSGAARLAAPVEKPRLRGAGPTRFTDGAHRREGTRRRDGIAD